MDKQKMKDQLDLINKANECSVLMTLLCEKMGLVPKETNHNQFINRFVEIQTKSLEYQKELQEIYISTGDIKTRKKREKKEETQIHRLTKEEASYLPKTEVSWEEEASTI